MLLIGDSWIWRPSDELIRLARTEGTIGPNEEYVVEAVDAQNIDAIVGQYNAYNAQRPHTIKVIIMNGGGWDLLSLFDPSVDRLNETIPQVVDTFTQFLDQVAGDGVQHVIYSLYRWDGQTPNISDLQPGMQTACDSSASLNGMPCHFLNLQDDMPPDDFYEYPGRYNPSLVVGGGAAHIAQEIWSIMQANCIAQSFGAASSLVRHQSSADLTSTEVTQY